MPSRREFLGTGLAALGLGIGGLAARARAAIANRCRPTGGLPLDRTDPLLKIDVGTTSAKIGGFRFAPGWFGDNFANTAIPFHFIPDYFNGGGPPPPQEEVPVAVVGGGLSGLASAYLLRDLRPVLFELRPRFGGNATGERWEGIPYSIGSAYLIAPDPGSFLERFYRELGLDQIARVSLPPDPVELGGVIIDDFWSGQGVPVEQRAAFQRYADIVRHFAEDYPEIPLSADPAAQRVVRDLDTRSFLDDLQMRLGEAPPPLLAAGIQGYFYSSFNAGMQEISAAAGWNFVAAEEYGRWVFPGGNARLAYEMWRRLRALELELSEDCRPRFLRAGCRVVDVRPQHDRMIVTYIDSDGAIRSIAARHVVMAGSKHIVKHVIHELEAWDWHKYAAINTLGTYGYIVVNVLLDRPIARDFYDVFRLGQGDFPMTPWDAESQRRVIDVIRGDYAEIHGDRSVLTLYWALPWTTSRFGLIVDAVWKEYAERLAPQLRAILELLEVPESAVAQVRMTRWGHAMPVAAPDFIAGNWADACRRPLGEQVFFANQDNWALPAVETALLEAKWVADAIHAVATPRRRMG